MDQRSEEINTRPSSAQAPIEPPNAGIEKEFRCAELPSPATNETTTSEVVTVSELVAMRLSVDGMPRMRVSEHDAVDLRTAFEELPRYIDALNSARSRLARAAKVAPVDLPIVLSIMTGEMVLSVTTPRGKDPAPILEATRDLCAAITDQWRKTTENAEHYLGEADKPEADVKPNPLSSANDGNCKTEVETTEVASDQAKSKGNGPQVQADPLQKRMQEALLSRGGRHSLSLNFSAGGQDNGPAIIIPPAPVTPAHITLSEEPREIEAKVIRSIGAGRCLIRETGVVKQKRSTFSTSEQLSSVLNMLAGCPAVVLEVRDYKSDDGRAKPPDDFAIDRIVALTDDWFSEPLVFDHLQACLDVLRDLMTAGCVKSTT